MKGACHGSVWAGLTKTNSDAPSHLSWPLWTPVLVLNRRGSHFPNSFSGSYFSISAGGGQNLYRHGALAHRRAVFPCCYFWSFHVDPAISMATSVSADVFMRCERVLLPVPPPSIKELVHFESVAPSFLIHFYEQEAALGNDPFVSAAH